MATKSNPLDQVAGVNKVSNLSLPRPPRLKNLQNQHGFSLGTEAYDDAWDQYVNDLERVLNERLQPRAPTESKTI